MDRAEHGLAMLFQGCEQVKNRPCSLAIETRRRLVEENEELWSRSKFDADCQTLALFYVQAWVRQSIELYVKEVGWLPSPGTPTTASAYSSIPRSLMTSSTYSSLSFLDVVTGWRINALNCRDSLTVSVARCKSNCWA